MYTRTGDRVQRGAAGAEPSTAQDGDAPRDARPENPRQLLLLQTTLRLIGERGIDAVSHRSVAEAAGVPLGSTTYWFPGRQEMLRQALEHFAREEAETLRERLAPVLDRSLSRRRLVDELTAILVPQLEEEGRWRTAAQYALLQEASRRPELEPACREWTRAWEEVLGEVFASLGAPRPEFEARMFLAMLDGILMGQLAAPDPDPERTVIRPALKAWFDRVPTRPGP